MSGEVAYGGVSDLVRLGRGGAFSLSGIWPGHLGIGGDSGPPVGEGSPGALEAGGVEAALGAGLRAVSLLSTPFLPTSCPQGLRSTATHPRGRGVGAPLGACMGTSGPACTKFLELKLLAALKGGREEAVVLGGCSPLGNTGRHLPRQKGLGGSWGPGWATPKACDWEQELSSLSSSSCCPLYSLTELP